MFYHPREATGQLTGSLGLPRQFARCSSNLSFQLPALKAIQSWNIWNIWNSSRFPLRTKQSTRNESPWDSLTQLDSASVTVCTAFGQTSMETISKVTSFLEHNTHSTKWKKCGYHQRHGPVWRHDACLHCNPYVWENTKVRNCCSTTVSTIRHEGASKSRYCVTDRCFATAKDALLVYPFFWLVLCNSCGLPHFALIKQLLLME